MLLSVSSIYFKADGKKQKQNQSQVPVTGLSIPTQPLTRALQPLPPLQPSPVQQPGVPTSGPSQTTIHVLPTASTTVNVTHQPMAPAVPKLPIPRTPSKHQVVYTTIPAPPAQNPVRGAVMTSPGLRPVTPQTGGRGRFLPCASYCDTAGMIHLMDVAFIFFYLGLLLGLFTVLLVLVREVRGFFPQLTDLRKFLGY